MSAAKLQRGFSLVETLVAVTIAAILAAYGIPAAVSSVRNVQFRSQIDQVSALVSYARAQALAGKSIGVKLASSPSNTLSVVDISNPSAPKTLKSLTLPSRYTITPTTYTPNTATASSPVWGSLNTLYATYPILFSPTGYAPLLNSTGQTYGQLPWGELKIQDPYTDPTSGRGGATTKYIAYVRSTAAGNIVKIYGQSNR